MKGKNTKGGETKALKLSISSENTPVEELCIHDEEIPSVDSNGGYKRQSQLLNTLQNYELLHHVALGTASLVGVNFFDSLAQHLADAMRVRYAFIAQCTDASLTRVRTLSFWNRDKFEDNIEFDLAGTPCANVIAGNVCIYPENLQTLFPEDTGLADMRAESYLGIPIRDVLDNVLGHIAILDDKTMADEPLGIDVLKIFAARAGAEMERKLAEDALRENFIRLSKKSRYDTIIANVMRVVHQSLDPAVVFENAVEALSASIEKLNCVGIYIIEGEEAVLKAERGYPDKFLQINSRIPKPAGLTWQAIISEEPKYYPDLDVEQISSMGKKLGIKSFLCVPIKSEGKTIGTLDITSFHKQAFDDDELKLLEIISRQVETAINNAKHAEELKASQQSLSKALGELEKLKNRLNMENVYLKEEINTENNFDEIVGRSPEIKAALRHVEQVSGADTTVLIQGETGTGKELIARAIHSLSPRRDRAMVKVNCGAISPSLVESELFGHEKGAFTGALQKRIGRFEMADGGTIFLDEVGELSAELQVKLLRVLQEGEFERVGSNETIKVDVRVIAATNRDLAESVRDKSFRADLYYRLNIFPIHVPALRDRKEDIPLLANFFLTRFSRKLGKNLSGFADSAMISLMEYQWPGNIRELQNVIERAVVVSAHEDAVITGPITGEVTQSISTDRQHDKVLENVERSHIIKVLEETRWVINGKGGAAEILNINPNTLRSRMKKLHIKRPEERI